MLENPRKTQMLWVWKKTIYCCLIYHIFVLKISPKQMQWLNFLVQVIIGGINVDFIAKGKTETLHVSISLQIYLKHCCPQSENKNLRICLSFSLDRPTQEVCVSHLVVWEGTSLVSVFLSDRVCADVFDQSDCVSHILFYVFPQDSLSRLDKRPLFISVTGADANGDAVFNYCKHMVREL